MTQTLGLYSFSDALGGWTLEGMDIDIVNRTHHIGRDDEEKEEWTLLQTGGREPNWREALLLFPILSSLLIVHRQTNNHN
jgi:hypothetical protein